MPTPDCDSEYVLWCLVEDDDRPFPVLISRTSHVFHLKELVLTMVTSGPYRDANAKDIILMKINVNFYENADRISTSGLQLNAGDEIFLDNPMEEIAQIWPMAPLEGYISVFVCPPGPKPRKTTLGKRPYASDGLDSVRESKLLKRSPSVMGVPYMYKSLQGESSQRILDDRPEADAIVPASLLYHGFGHFMDNFRLHKGHVHLNSKQCDLERNADHFAEQMTKFYQDEDLRATHGLEALGRILGVSLILANTDCGHYYGPHNAATFVVKFQNEHIYSMAMVELTSHIAHLHKQSLDQYGALFKGWNVPSLGLTVVGPCVTFYGVIFLGQWRVVSLTPTLSCVASATEGKDRMALYAAFSATVDLLHCIDQDAQHFICASPTIPHADRKFPYVSELPNYHAPNNKFQFHILRCHSFQDNQSYLYIAQTPDKKEVIVKFTCQYSIALHAFCADHGYAPGILGFGTIPGGWFGIAMDYISPTVHPLQSPHLLRLRNKWIGDLRVLVKSFHDKGLVHGDLREPNIICDGEQVMLVDFDWGGAAGEASYPRANLNPELIDGRASTDVEITKGDDIRVLENTITKLCNV